SALELGVAGLFGCKCHRWRAVRPQPDRVRGFPFLFADIEMIVARRAAPVDVLRRLARDETAGLPEAFAGAGAAAGTQAVDDVGGDTAGFKHKARQRRGERSAFAIGTSYCENLLGLEAGLCGHQPIRVFNCLITSGMVRPSARAEKVSAMRCLRMGSA